MSVLRLFKIENNSVSNIRNKQGGTSPQLGLAFKLGSGWGWVGWRDVIYRTLSKTGNLPGKM